MLLITVNDERDDRQTNEESSVSQSNASAGKARRHFWNMREQVDKDRRTVKSRFHGRAF